MFSRSAIDVALPFHQNPKPLSVDFPADSGAIVKDEPFSTSCIRRDNHAVLDVVVASDVVDHGGFGIKLHIKECLEQEPKCEGGLERRVLTLLERMKRWTHKRLVIRFDRIKE